MLHFPLLVFLVPIDCNVFGAGYKKPYTPLQIIYTPMQRGVNKNRNSGFQATLHVIIEEDKNLKSLCSRGIWLMHLPQGQENHVHPSQAWDGMNFPDPSGGI